MCILCCHFPPSDLPFDQSCRLIWWALAGDPKLATTVLEILLDVLGQNQANFTKYLGGVADPESVYTIVIRIQGTAAFSIVFFFNRRLVCMWLSDTLNLN